jgi:cobalt-zinc-cadmium efflux system outer membrane protein
VVCLLLKEVKLKILLFLSGLVLCVSLLTLFSQQIQGQELILDSLLAEGLRTNPDLKAANFRFQSEKLKAKASGTLPDPTLGLAFSNLPIDSYRLDETPMSGISLGITQMVPFPMKLRAKSDIGHLKATSAELSETELKNELVRKIKSVFYHLSYWNSAIAIIKENISLMEGLEQVAEARYSAGEGLASDVLRAQTSVSQLRNRLISAEKIYESSEEMLSSLLNRPVGVALGTPHDLPENLPDLNLDSLLKQTVEQNPELEKSRIKLQLAEKRKSLAKWNFWPDLSFGVDYRIRESSPMDAVKGSDFLSFRIGLSLPLWFFAKQNKHLGSADENLKAAQDMDEGMQRMVQYQVIERYQEAEKSKAQFELYRDAILPQARSTLESSMIAYQVGKVDFLTLITSQISVFNFEIEKLSTLNSFHQALADLEELTGSIYKGDLK